MELSGKAILLTGVTGYLGKRFATKLLEDTTAHLYLFGRAKKGVFCPTPPHAAHGMNSVEGSGQNRAHPEHGMNIIELNRSRTRW